ncbi:MAG: RlmF-related methyltransferase, partial [Shewanella sp.]
SSLVSKKENLPAIYRMLKQLNASQLKTFDMAQGQKVSRMVAWSFLTEQQIADWRKYRWRG